MHNLRIGLRHHRDHPAASAGPGAGRAHAVPSEGGLALCGEDCHTVTDMHWPPLEHPDVCDECLDLMTLS